MRRDDTPVELTATEFELLRHLMRNRGGCCPRRGSADASHELPTPLAAIRGYAELTYRVPLAPETEYSIARISSRAER